MLRHISLVGLGVLFCVNLGSAQWQNPENVGNVVNSNANEQRPCISLDGTTLYFSSDRAGGQGHDDIWMATKAGRVWQNLTNLGTPVNSDRDDFLPCISSDGDSLFFVSNRFPTESLDIWKSWKDGGNWQQPKLLPPPVNSDETE